MSMKIAKNGGNVLTDPIRDLSMTSEAKSLKIAFEGTWSKAVDPAVPEPTPVTIAHNLGYAPCFRVSGQNDPAQSQWFLYPNASGAVNALVYADSTNLYIKFYVNGYSDVGTISGYYYIFEDSQ